MDSYFKQRAEKSQRSTDECMNNVADKVDRLYQDINDVNQKRNNLTSDIEEVEDDIRKLADLCSHMSSHSAAAY